MPVATSWGVVLEYGERGGVYTGGVRGVLDSGRFVIDNFSNRRRVERPGAHSGC